MANNDNIHDLIAGHSPQDELLKHTRKLVEKWEPTGLLEGIKSETEVSSMSVLLENQATQLMKEASETSTAANKEEWSEDHPNFVHIQDAPGWHCKVGYYGRKEEHDKVMWHSAASNGEKRITLGFIVYEPEMWEPMVEELVEYDNSVKNN